MKRTKERKHGSEKDHSDTCADSVCSRRRYRLFNKDEALTLIDCGPNTKEAAESLSFQLKEHGVSAADIEQVVLTHHHADHSGLLHLFPRIRK